MEGDGDKRGMDLDKLGFSGNTYDTYRVYCDVRLVGIGKLSSGVR